MLHTLQNMQFNEPTEVQSAAIPLALEGEDLLCSAQTGTGKTGAFGIPIVTKLLLNTHSSALILTPTRELAAQVIKQIQMMLGRKARIKTALLIGGESMGRQLAQLRLKPRIIVGTPGRINDHLTQGTLSLKNTDHLVLDETDRMLDMGFTIQIENILKHMPSQRQTLLFSATLPKNIVGIANRYLNDPKRIAVGSKVAANNIDHDILRIKEDKKYPGLIAQLNDREGSIIVFVKTKYNAEKMAIKLNKDGHQADAIHGDLRQHKRTRVITNFRNQKYRILVATDIAARGIDIPHVRHVINYDLPQCPEDYVHRIGRTARGIDGQGSAISIITPANENKWRAIDRLLNPDAPRPPESKSSRKKNARPSARGRYNKKPSSKFAQNNNKPHRQQRRKEARAR